MPWPRTASKTLRGRVSPLNRGLFLMVLLLGSMGFYILYPLLLIFLNSFNIAPIGDPPVYGLGAWKDAFGHSEIWESLRNTLKVAFFRNLLTFPIGVLIAWILARTNIPFANGFEFLFWISYMLPSLAVTFGWILLLDPDIGLVNRSLEGLPFLGAVSFDIYSFWGIIWVHVVSGIDTKVMLLTPAFRRMDASFEEASRVSGASVLTTMFRITLPVMTPILVVVFLLGVIRSFESFEVELLLGAPWDFYVYSTKIVAMADDEPPLLNQAAALGSIILVIIGVMIPVQRWLIHRREFATVSSRLRPKLIDLGWGKYAVVGLMCVVVFLAVGVPILTVLGGSFMVRFGFFSLAKVWTLEYWRVALDNPLLLRALTNTLIIGGSAALVGAALFSLIAYVLVRTKLPGRALLDSLCWLPSAVPGVLAGLGLLWMFLATPIFRPFYGTLFLLMIASMMGGLTLSTQILKGNFIQLGEELEEASRVSGAGYVRTYFRIVLPLMAQSIVLIGVLKFLFAARSTASLILLATSETKTLALLALDQISYGEVEVANVTIVFVVLLTTGLALIARAFGLRVGIRAE